MGINTIILKWNIKVIEKKYVLFVQHMENFGNLQVNTSIIADALNVVIYLKK